MSPTEEAIKNLMDENYVQTVKACDKYQESKSLLIDKMYKICTIKNKNAVDWEEVRKHFMEF